MSDLCCVQRKERYEACDDEDGGLIGGAALKVPDFLQIINAANQE